MNILGHATQFSRYALFIFLSCISACCTINIHLVFASEPSTKLTAEKKQSITLSIHAGTYEEYGLEHMVDICDELSLDESVNHHRMAVELELICYAFNEAQFPVTIKAIPAPTYARALRFVEQGMAHSVAESIWSKSIRNDDDFYITEPVIQRGEFEKGIFTQPQHPLQSQPVNEIQFAQYSSVTFRTWHHDYKILKAISKHVYTTTEFSSLTKMLSNGRADFSILEFQKENPLGFEYKGVKLKPINGIKIQINDYRAFVISKKKANSDTVFKALNTGIQSLRARGEIELFYTKYGLFSNAVKDWKALDINTSTM